MFITIPREEAHARLHASGWRQTGLLFEVVEVWRHTSGLEVSLAPKLDGTGAYEDEMIKAAEALA